MLFLRNLSLRTRLIFYYTVFFAFALFLLSFGTYFAVWQSLDNNVNEDIRAGARQVLAIYERSPVGGLDFVLNNGVIGVITPEQLSGQPAEIFSNPNLFVQVFSPNGEFLGSSMPRGDLLSSSMRQQNQLLPLPDGALQLSQGDELMVDIQVGDQRMRSLVVPVNLTATGQIVGFLHVTRSLADVERTTQLLVSILIGGGVIALIVTAFGVAGLSRTALAPINQVIKTSQGIVKAEDLGQRVPVPNTQDEIHHLTVTINAMLGRMEELFRMQQRLVADVSHELRTPLTAMQGNIEVLQRGAHRDPELLEESLTDMRHETARLIRMVNDLLLLAKSELRVQMRRDPVELDTLVLEVHRELRPLANGITLAIGAEDQAVVTGDRDRLKQALLNLGINAIQHTPASGKVTLGLERRDGYAVISVRDTGSGIAPEDLPNIFKRFYRADSSRARRGSGGSGLGLSIVDHVATAHGGTVQVESIVGVGSRFSLWVPLTNTQSLTPPAALPDEASSRITSRLTDQSGIKSTASHPIE